MFDWGTKYCRNRFDILNYAENKKIPIVTVPHGMQIFKFALTVDKTKINQAEHMLAYNYPDKYIFQSSFHAKQEINFGLNPKITRILGSARFDLEWINELKKIFKLKNYKQKKIIVMFLPHIAEGFEIKNNNILKTLKLLKKTNNTKIILKPHTRYTLNQYYKTDFYKKFYKLFKDRKKIFFSDKNSFQLSKNADLILFSGASIFRWIYYEKKFT